MNGKAYEGASDRIGAGIAPSFNRIGRQPAAWRVRGYSQFKTGEPGPWRYIDGAERPKVNNPECCDFEPLYL